MGHIPMRYTSGRWLEANWERGRVEGIAMMTYNPSIGRVLASGGVEIFKKIARRAVRNLDGIQGRQEFEQYHRRLVHRMQESIHTSKDKRLSYGQGQKAVNVFLKVYIDWAKLPDRQTATRLATFLHVPLDSIVMNCVRKEHERAFTRVVAPIYQARGEDPWDSRLSIISSQMYHAWQRLFVEIRPHRPIDLDVIWSRAPRE